VDFEEAFDEVGIGEGGQPVTVPAEKSQGERQVEALLREDTSLARYHLTPPLRKELGALLESDGVEPFRQAFNAAVEARPMRRGKAFLSYVSQTLGTLAAKRDNGSGPRGGSSRSREPLTRKRVYE